MGWSTGLIDDAAWLSLLIRPRWCAQSVSPAGDGLAVESPPQHLRVLVEEGLAARPADGDDAGALGLQAGLAGEA